MPKPWWSLLYSTIIHYDIYSFKEETIDGVQDLWYYVESDGKKYCMMVQPNGDVTILPAEDLVPDSIIDIQCRFRTVL